MPCPPDQSAATLPDDQVSQGLQNGRGHPKTALPAEEDWGPDRTASDPSTVSHRLTWLRSFHLQEALPAVTVVFYSVFWSARSDLRITAPPPTETPRGSCLHPAWSPTLLRCRVLSGVKRAALESDCPCNVTWYLCDVGKETYSSETRGPCAGLKEALEGIKEFTRQRLGMALGTE